MRLYFSHYRHYDYEHELYEPVRSSTLSAEHEVMFPHENGEKKNTKELVRSADIVFAEVSHSATGLGIELGWADAFGKRIVCLYRAGSEPSNSLHYITEEFIEYADAADLVEKVRTIAAAGV